MFYFLWAGGNPRVRLHGGCGCQSVQAKAKNTFPWGVRTRAHYGAAAPQSYQLARKLARLLSEAEFMNDGFIALGIVFLQIIQQATPLADQHEKAAARTVVFLVRFEVFRQLTNAFAQQSDLDFRTARIGGMRSVLVYEGFLLLSG